MVTFKPTDSMDYTNAIDTVTIDVNPAVLTVAANNVSMSYGDALPTLDDTLTGFVNGESQSVVSGAATLSTTATSSSHPAPIRSTSMYRACRRPITPSRPRLAH